MHLRKWQYGDIPMLVSALNNPAITNNLRDGLPSPYREEDGADFVAACLRENPADCLSRAIKVDGKAVGSIGVFRSLTNPVYGKTAEIGYYLDEAYWGRGIMTCAVKQICRMAFATMDLVRISGEVYAYNLASASVLEKAGFQKEGVLRKSVFKNGVIHDSHIYALVKE